MSDEFLDACLSVPNPRPEEMRETYGVMAAMLRGNCLTGSGREFLADRLQAVADGADPTRVFLPRNRKPAAPPILKIMAEVERERAKRGSGDMAKIYARVGRRHGLEPATIAKLASRGRTHLRGAVAHMLATTGREPDIALVAGMLGLRPAVVEMLLKPRRRG